jgi:hypothetical protein
MITEFGDNPFQLIYGSKTDTEAHAIYGAQVPDGVILRFEDRYGGHTTNIYMYIAAEKIVKTGEHVWLHPMR